MAAIIRFKDSGMRAGSQTAVRNRGMSFRQQGSSGMRRPLLSSEHSENDQRSESRDVQGHVQRIGPDAVARGQKGVRVAEHDLIARRARGLWSKQVWNPPCQHLEDEQKPVVRPEPHEQPWWVWSPEEEDARHKPEGAGNEADEGISEKFAARIRCANGLYVVEASERDPIVQPQKQ
jgi:hypothetical protein